jgi:hypothetical protein
MLTRLKVSGFKNLHDVDVRFGPFTCVLGPNGVGKSNIFDAIAFLCAMADKPLAEAAALVRGSEGRIGDVRSLFRTSGADRVDTMRLEAEMVVPSTGADDLGSPAKASMTFLRYGLTLRHRTGVSPLGPLEIVDESMKHINRGEANKALGFKNSKAWRDDVIGLPGVPEGRRRRPMGEGARAVPSRDDRVSGALS